MIPGRLRATVGLSEHQRPRHGRDKPTALYAAERVGQRLQQPTHGAARPRRRVGNYTVSVHYHDGCRDADPCTRRLERRGSGGASSGGHQDEPVFSRCGASQQIRRTIVDDESGLRSERVRRLDLDVRVHGWAVGRQSPHDRSDLHAVSGRDSVDSRDRLVAAPRPRAARCRYVGAGDPTGSTRRPRSTVRLASQFAHVYRARCDSADVTGDGSRRNSPSRHERPARDWQQLQGCYPDTTV